MSRTNLPRAFDASAATSSGCFTLSRAAAGLGLMLAPAIYGAYGPRTGMLLGAITLGIVALWGLAGASRREREALG